MSDWPRERGIVSGRAVNAYATAQYAASLTAMGEPIPLRNSRGWVLERPIGGSSLRDAAGCYPLFAVEEWSQLPADLSELTGLVSLVVVTDPFGAYDEALLKECFPDLVRPFKKHYVVDLAQPGRTWISRHHLRNARIGERQFRVEVCADPEALLDDWCGLYSTLIERHAIRGAAAFSRESFRAQLGMKELVAIRAVKGEKTEGMVLWFTSGDTAYYHLGAYSSAGYELRASYALFSYALDHFAANGVRWLALGAGAGNDGRDEGGLVRFKSGWANDVRDAYLCGRVLDRRAYDFLVKETNAESNSNDYFPAYRI